MPHSVADRQIEVPEVVQRLLAQAGVGVSGPNPWTNKYIFPNGHLPSANRITSALEPDMYLLDWHNFGPDYDATLMAWWHNFDRNWQQIRDNYLERFYRM